MRVVVSMAGSPAARDSVDELAAVAEKNPASLRARDGKRLRRRLHLRVGQPNMANAPRKPVRQCAAHLSPPILHAAPPAAAGRPGTTQTRRGRLCCERFSPRNLDRSWPPIARRIFTTSLALR